MIEDPFPSLGTYQEIRSTEKQHADYMISQKDDLQENLGELNNLGHEEAAEDFADSPYADRVDDEELSTEEEVVSDTSQVIE